ncbi:hypothetical protein Tco_0044079, partial [Tanacetum coccineum]
ESKAYKTYLGHATCVVPPKIARKFKKASPSKKDSIDLLSEVALAKKAQLKEVRKKSLRDFHKKHPSGSGIVAEKPPSVEKITPTVTSEGTGDKPGIPNVTEHDSTESESESWGNESESESWGNDKPGIPNVTEHDSTEKYDFEERYKAFSEKLDWENPKGGDYPFDLSKPLPLITHGKHTHVKVMKKHGYGYMEEIVVRRADNALYRFKEGDFPRLRINDIEDMLLLVY